MEAVALKLVDSHEAKHNLKAEQGAAERRIAQAADIDFASLYAQHKRRVYATVHHIVGYCDEIDDIVQTVFLQIHRSLPRYKGQSKLSTWIYRISVNVSLQYIRKRKRRRVFLRFTSDNNEFERAGNDVRAQYDEREVMKRLYEFLDTLSDKKRTVFVLHELDGLAFEDIAEVCSIPVNTVRSRLHAARSELTIRLRRAGLLEGYHGRG